ncbi:stage III sporulation protein AF [Paenibacillus sp.]|jgi:stage III sporulation protein AF|uniref:stage III sporulation protein AF n=1 Tax=Paenibacillus sp. TaxID=58172 RepID=UPI002838F82A|nr:stage III sporulation protein AF [Paenibacillus sp.]MDR0267048.1 stage III sporulation protein AF [Paenibacillus sp.]
MTWLSSWLKEVIMVVLLAAFVDLILPSKSMERYVKLVLSLLILLTLLSPLVKLITEAADVKLAGAFNRINQQTAAGGTNLQQIMEQANEMKSRQQNQSLEWAAQEIAAQMKEQILKAGRHAAEVKVVLGMQEGRDGVSGTNPYIKSVTVTLQPEEETATEKNKTDGANSSGDINIEPVTPVQVEVQADGNRENPANSDGTSEKVSGTPEQDNSGEHAETIKKLLENNWGIEPETIVIQNSASDNRKL